MFKFGFDKTSELRENTVESTEIEWLSAKKIEPDDEFTLPENPDVNYFKCDGVPQIKYLSKNAVLQRLKDGNTNPVLLAEHNHSDLVTGIYEGGLKIWECTYDLANHICDLELENKTILDLGCGAGIIGILSLLKGSRSHFQDYNPEVISSITIPNVVLNLEGDAKAKLETCRFYCGDWGSFSEIELNRGDDSGTYDYIFTSETIYNNANYEKLHDLFAKKLKVDGVVYLAAKAYYFGIGGGLREFEELVKKKDVFDFETCWSCTSGVHREILRISFKK